MNITLIGTGFVGVVSAAVYASFGNKVIGLDIDDNKVASLNQGKVPFFEPGLEEILIAQLAEKNLHFTTSYQEAISQAELIIIAVGTPSTPEGNADLTFVMAAAESLAEYLQPQTIVAIKSTVPPGTLDTLATTIAAKTETPFLTASLPEFLKEGTAVHDTLNPDRVVIGATDESVFEKMENLHKPFQAPVVRVKPESAQMGKYAANAYLATRITFINQIADLCEKNGANIEEVINIIGQDQRIGRHYWYPGLGYGGSCFPKDVNELAAYSRTVGEANNLFNKVAELNEHRVSKILSQYEETVGDWSGKKVAVLGLSFKPNTNDMREAPSTKVIPYLLEKGAQVVGFDPEAQSAAESIFPTHEHLTYAQTVSAAIIDADVIMALIEWPEIITFDFISSKCDKTQYFFDARNQFDESILTKAGYHYIGIGK